MAEPEQPATIQTLNPSVDPTQSGGFRPLWFREIRYMTYPPPDGFEPIDPHTARELYLDHKASECADVTAQSHKYRTMHFVRWCDENSTTT